MRIAMWSGPRNLSTAMMYAFAARDDCAVVDEPFYATYLQKTGLDHPMRTEILASQPREPRAVSEGLLGPIPGGKKHFYQKHMTQHMVPGVDRDWMAEVTNIFLIRHPARVIASYAAKREAPELDDIGFWQQAELYQHAVSLGQDPVVIDSEDIRRNPKAALGALCTAIGLSFQESMLTWPEGGHPDDGIWARHWYGAVHRSKGFAGAEGPLPDIPDKYQSLLIASLPHYENLAQHALLRSSG